MRPLERHDPLRAYRIANVALFSAILLATTALVLAKLEGNDGQRLTIAKFQLPELCDYKRASGRACSSCGLTRSVVSVFDGRLEQANAFHPSGVSIAGFLVFQLLLRGLFATRRFAAHWKWDAVLTAVSIVIGFGGLILQLPQPVQ